MLVLLVLIIIVFGVYFSHCYMSTEVDIVPSEIDHNDYIVRNLPDKNRAADLLAQIRQRMVKLVSYLGIKYPKDVRVTRLIEKFDPSRISESSSDNKYTSYSINKGEKIVFCVRQRDKDQNLLDLNTMVFVAIHELAHIMTESVGHTEEFWTNMKFLLSQSISDDLKIYQYQPYHEKPQEYCGTSISDTPLK